MRDELLPSVPEILSDTSCSTWLRSSLQSALFNGRNPSDIAREAQLMADVLAARAQAPRDATGFAYYDGRRASDVDVLLPLVEVASVALRMAPTHLASGRS